MNFFITLLTVVEVIVCLLLSLLVLMQRPRQEGLGAAFGSGVTDQMFGAQTTNVLQKATVYLGATLFGLTFLLAILVSRQDDRAAAKATFVEPGDKVVKTPPPEAPAAPAANTAAEPKKDGPVAPAPAATTPTPAKPADNKPADSKPAEPKTTGATPATAAPASSTALPIPPAPTPVK